MLDAQWFQCLDEEMSWLVHYQENPSLLEIAFRILQQPEYLDATEVYDSSVWAVCHAYIDYHLNTNFLTPEELDYTRTRSGIIGSKVIQEEVVIVTIREFFEAYDYNFKLFMMGKNKIPPAA